MQLYVADYLGDTFHLTTEEHGAYLLLMMTYWQSGKPIHKSRLAKAARLPDERWADVERTLNEYFTEDENGYWTHYRIDRDLKRVNAKSNQASKAGKASAAKRADSKSAKIVDNDNARSTGVQQTGELSLNHTDITNTDITKTNKTYTDEFEKLWSEYPKRAGGNPKKPAFNQIKARKNEGYTIGEISSGVIRYREFCTATGKIGTEYVMQTKRFLGRDKHFLEPWTLPNQPSGSNGEGKLARAARAMQEAKNEHITGNSGEGNAGHVGQTTPQLPKS